MTVPRCTDAADVIVASGDNIINFIANDIIDMDHFTDKNAGKAEQSVASAFSDYKQQVLDQLKSTMEDANAAFYTDLPREQQAYLSYIVNDILTQNGVWIRMQSIQVMLLIRTGKKMSRSMSIRI